MYDLDFFQSAGCAGIMSKYCSELRPTTMSGPTVERVVSELGETKCAVMSNGWCGYHAFDKASRGKLAGAFKAVAALSSVTVRQHNLTLFPEHMTELKFKMTAVSRLWVTSKFEENIDRRLWLGEEEAVVMCVVVGLHALIVSPVRVLHVRGSRHVEEVQASEFKGTSLKRGTDYDAVLLLDTRKEHWEYLLPALPAGYELLQHRRCNASPEHLRILLHAAVVVNGALEGSRAKMLHLFGVEQKGCVANGACGYDAVRQGLKIGIRDLMTDIRKEIIANEGFYTSCNAARGRIQMALAFLHSYAISSDGQFSHIFLAAVSRIYDVNVLLVFPGETYRCFVAPGGAEFSIPSYNELAAVTDAHSFQLIVGYSHPNDIANPCEAHFDVWVPRFALDVEETQEGVTSNVAWTGGRLSPICRRCGFVLRRASGRSLFAYELSRYRDGMAK